MNFFIFIGLFASIFGLTSSLPQIYKIIKTMKQIISKIAKTTIPSKVIQNSKNEIADMVYKLVEKEIQKFSFVSFSEQTKP